MALPDELEVHRRSLTGHCYRMLASSTDAEDAVQETMVRAWRALDRFDGRAALRTWLHRIATNVCLDMLNERSRRERPMALGPAGTIEDELVTRDRMHWLEPVPDARVLPDAADPGEIAVLKQSIRLAFVAALQHLPPRQRAALLLTEVLGWSAAEVSECLEMTTAAVNSALQRARATVSTRGLEQAADDGLSAEQADMLDRYVEAFERYDVDALASLLREDATMSMPPYELWLRGPEAVRGWLAGRGIGCAGSRLLPTAANGLPAFGQYRVGPAPGTWKPWGLVVLELDGARIAGWNTYLDVERLFPLFGLPMELTADQPAVGARR